jgi:hypothetical protein
MFLCLRKGRKANPKPSLDSPGGSTEEFSSSPYAPQIQDREADVAKKLPDTDLSKHPKVPEIEGAQIQEIDGVERKVTRIHEVDGSHQRNELEGTVVCEADHGGEIYELAAVNSRS